MLTMTMSTGVLNLARSFMLRNVVRGSVGLICRERDVYKECKLATQVLFKCYFRDGSCSRNLMQLSDVLQLLKMTLKEFRTRLLSQLTSKAHPNTALKRNAFRKCRTVHRYSK